MEQQHRIRLGKGQFGCVERNLDGQHLLTAHLIRQPSKGGAQSALVQSLRCQLRHQRPGVVERLVEQLIGILQNRPYVRLVILSQQLAYLHASYDKHLGQIVVQFCGKPPPLRLFSNRQVCREGTEPGVRRR